MVYNMFKGTVCANLHSLNSARKEISEKYLTNNFNMASNIAFDI